MQKFAFSVLLVITTLVVYREVRNLDYVWTDRSQLTSLMEDAGPKLKGIPGFWKISKDSDYAPVSATTIALTTALAQESLQANAPKEASSGQMFVLPSARIYHITSFMLHTANVVLVFLILSLCLTQVWAAFLGAMLFSLHPLQTEAVAWISAQPFLLGSFFSLVALWQYLIFSKQQETFSRSARIKFKPIKHYYVASGAFVVALLCSPLAVVTPLLGLALDHLRPSDRSLRAIQRPVWPMTIWAIPAIICGLLAATLQNTNAAMLASPLWLRPFIAGDTISFYLYKIFVPVNIGPDFGRSPLFVRAHLWGYATWLVPISLGFFLAFGRDKTRSLLSGALSVFIFALIPFAGLLAFEAQATSTVASRYAYLAMLGPALALGALASIPRRPATGVLAVAVLIALGFMTQTQIKSWQNDETLWKKALAVNANSPIAHAVLAEQYRLQQNWDEARLHYRKVLEVNASDPKTHFYLAEIERRQGDLPQALELYRKTLELDPTYSPAYNSYGLALLASGQINEALERFTKAVELTPNSSEPLVNLGRLYAQMKKFPEAVPVLNKALSIQGAADTRSQKQLAEIHALLGLALASTNDDVKAQTHLEMALKLDGTSAESHRTLADIYFVQKRYADALSHYQEAAKSITDDPEVFNNIGVILAMEKKYDKAVVQYEKALALRPEFISAHTSVGTAYFFLRKFPDATNHFRRSLALDPNQADPHYYLGDMARWQNKESEALGEYYAALKIDPNHVDSHYRLGNHFLKKEQMDQAIRHYQAALKVAPNDPRLIGQLRRAERAMQTLPM